MWGIKFHTFPKIINLKVTHTHENVKVLQSSTLATTPQRLPHPIPVLELVIYVYDEQGSINIHV